MANNRVNLRCKGCGEEIMLGKSFGDEWYFSIPDAEKGRQLNEFLRTHSDCCKGLEHDTCGGISPYDPNFEPFELTYENQPDWGFDKPTLQQKDKELHPDKYEL